MFGSLLHACFEGGPDCTFLLRGILRVGIDILQDLADFTEEMFAFENRQEHKVLMRSDVADFNI